MTTNPTTIKDKLNQLSAFMDEQQGFLDKGVLVHLQNIDEEISEVCEALLTLPPQEAQEMQPLMENVITKLEKLAVGLQQFQTTLKP